MIEFLQMDGYAVYVWSSYGVSILGIGGLAIWAVLEARAASRLPKDTPAQNPSANQSENAT